MRWCICADIGASRLRVALARDDGTIVEQQEVKTTDVVQRNPNDELVIANAIIELASKLLSKHAVHVSELAGIGIGSIGPLDLRRGTIVKSPNLPNPELEYPLTEPIKDKFKVPVYLANDCVTAVWGEVTYGKGRNFENVVYITMSTGIGGGAVVNGTLLLGADGNAHEVGHVIVDTSDDALVCGCGGKGHWEAYCSGIGIPKLIKREIEKQKEVESPIVDIVRKYKDPRDVTVEFFRLLKEGDKFCRYVFDKICIYNARGVSTVIHLYNPEIIILGGSIVLNNSDLILEFKKYLPEYLMRGFREPTFTITEFGDQVVLVGAAALVFNTPPSLKRFFS